MRSVCPNDERAAAELLLPDHRRSGHLCSLANTPVSDRSAPTAIDCHDPQEHAESSAQQHRVEWGDTHDVPDRHDRTGGERRYGVKMAPQDGRHIASEDIALAAGRDQNITTGLASQ
jgi:hypothetical protein